MKDMKLWLDFFRSFLWCSLFWVLLITIHSSLKHFLNIVIEIIRKRGLKITKDSLKIPKAKNDSTESLHVELSNEDIDVAYDKEKDIKTIKFYSLEEPFLTTAQSYKNDEYKDNFLSDQLQLSLKNWLEGQNVANKNYMDIIKKKMIKICIELYFERCIKHLGVSDTNLLIKISEEPIKNNISDGKYRLLEMMKFTKSDQGQIIISPTGKDFLHYIKTYNYI